jgi:hypothetical protein
MEEKVSPGGGIAQELAYPTTFTDEDLAIEKQLRRKIDYRIMPVVISVYLMNYIDRCVTPLQAVTTSDQDLTLGTTMRLRNYKG